jgi:hypothetical protein
MTLIAFLGTVFNYALRVSINLAMVAMVNHTAIPHINETIRAQECLIAAVDVSPPAAPVPTNVAARSAATLKPGEEMMFEVGGSRGSHNLSASLFQEEGHNSRVAADTAAIHPVIFMNYRDIKFTVKPLFTYSIGQKWLYSL